MSRSNPYKKAKREAKKTILFYGEGEAESIFLKHLKKMYANNSGIAVTIRNGHGGTAEIIVHKAIQYPGDFDRRVVVLDNDKLKQEMEQARKLAGKCEIDLIENTPCLEALLQSIVDGGKPKMNKSSAQYKKNFEKNHICKEKRLDPREYEKLFTIKLLDKRRKEIKNLEVIIGFMEG
jgi:ribosome assembly protein YihI (activator of Der GTPase)